MMATKISEMIDLLSSDDDSVVSFPPPKIGSNPRQKKRPPFLSLNGRDFHKLRSNDNNKDKDPRSHMQRLLHREDQKTKFLFSSYKTQTISYLGSPPCHSYIPTVTDPVVRQRIFENQVGQAFDATDAIVLRVIFPASCGTYFFSRASQTRKKMENTTLRTERTGICFKT